MTRKKIIYDAEFKEKAIALSLKTQTHTQTAFFALQL